MQELIELTRILDRDNSQFVSPGETMQIPDAADMQSAIQLLWRRQFIYSTDRLYSRSYEIASWANYRPFFEKYFAAAGYDFICDPACQMVGIVPPTNRVDRPRVQRDETTVIIALRLAYDEAMLLSEGDDLGHVNVGTIDITDRISSLIGSDKTPKIGRMKEILRGLQRRGIVRLGNSADEDGNTDLVIYPGITHILSDAKARAIKENAELKRNELQDNEPGEADTPLPGGTDHLDDILSTSV